MENAKEDSDSVEILVVLGDDEEEREKGEETVYVTVADKEIKGMFACFLFKLVSDSFCLIVISHNENYCG